MRTNHPHAFDTRDLSVVALFSGAWGTLNSLFSPVVFRMFGIPILCDVIGFACLSVVVWWLRKPGSATMVGSLSTVLSFLLNPAGIQFLGFTAASVVFDVVAWVAGYERLQERAQLTTVAMMTNSVLSACFAGFIIGIFFMPPLALQSWGGPLGWAILHASGGLIGGGIGSTMVAALSTRGIARPMRKTRMPARESRPVDTGVFIFQVTDKGPRVRMV